MNTTFPIPVQAVMIDLDGTMLDTIITACTGIGKVVFMMR